MSVPIAIKTEEVILENAEYNSAEEELDEDLQLQLEDSGGESSYIQYQEVESEIPQRQRHHQQNSNMNNSGGQGSRQSNNSGAASNNNNGGSNNKITLESEKRMRREIANSNERRRMQSINAGFQNLRSLLPRHEGEKLSKAAILQQTSQYICELENQKTQLLAQNSQLKRQLGQHESSTIGDSAGSGVGGNSSNAEPSGAVAIKKRKLTDNIISLQTISDSSDEGLGSMSPEPMTLLNAAAAAGTGSAVSTKNQMIIAHNAKELLEMKKQLDKERRMRTMIEEEMQAIKRQLYSVATAPPQSTTTYIPREVIEHTDNLVRDTTDELLPAGTVSYVEIDEMTGQQQVVICSSIEELDSESAAADIITEDNVQEEVILSSTSSTESEHEVNVNAIAKAYAEGTSPTAAVLQPILQAAIKATPKVEVERIHETIIKVKTEKIEQPSGITRSRQNLETIVEAIRHLEGDHLFGDVSEQQKLQQQNQKAQEAPLALTTKQQQAHAHAHAHAQRATLAELRPYLQLKGGVGKQVTIVGGSGAALTLTTAAASTIKREGANAASNITVTPTALHKVQTTTSTSAATGASSSSIVGGNSNINSGTATAQQVTITTTALKQCRPGVIVAKQLS